MLMRKPAGQALMARALATTAIAAGMSLLVAVPAQAQSGSVTLNIAPGALAGALNQFAETTGYQLLYPSELVQGKTSLGASGTLSISDGLGRILGGTGLSFKVLDGKTIQISTTAPADGEKVTGAVRVEGAQGSPYFGGAGVAVGVNGTNGSRDITATEGTKSFTSGALTVGSKVPQALKDVPQSISVLTSERLEQQNVTDFNTALNQLPGVMLVQSGFNLSYSFYSRGFEITSIQVDGGAPLRTGFGGNSGFFPQIDMSVYDHVELLRGADGLFNGYGDPSGSVNLVRKKPLDHAQVTLDGELGSWDNYRLVADATSPLALNGKLRGRLVMTWQDEHHFYEVAKDSKELIYGILELDATPTTLLTAGINYTEQNSVPFDGGLPRYQTGADLKLPRSTAIIFPWNRWDFKTREIFGSIEQKIGSDWTFKVNLTQNRQTSIRKLGYNGSTVNPLNDSGPFIRSAYSDFAGTQFSAEAVLTGAFELFGQRQEVTIGANRVNSDAGGQTTYAAPISSSAATPYQPFPGGPTFCSATTCTVYASAPPINVFNFNPYDPVYTEPRNPLPTGRFLVYAQAQSVAYANLRLTAFDRLHLTTGIRWSRYESKNDSESLCTSIQATGTPSATNCIGRQIGDAYSFTSQRYSDSNFSWPPAANLSFDVTKQLTAYAGYTDIYVSNARYLDADHNPIGPTTGSNREIGLKWSPRSGRLNLSVAAYRIKQKGFAINDPGNPSQSFANGTSCCYLPDPNAFQQSEGIDAEVTGEVLPGWQVAASYTFNQNKYKGSSYGTLADSPIQSILPEHLYKLWTSYDFSTKRKSGWLSGLAISGGVNGQSSGYYSGSVCVNLLPPNPLTGASNCVSRNAPDTVPYSFTVPPYAVFSGRIDYRFSKVWSLAVNLENIFDRTYYQTVGSSVTGGNWYGAPRSFTVSLRGKW